MKKLLRGRKRTSREAAGAQTKKNAMDVHSRVKKITVDIPGPLYRKTEEVVQERHISISVFVREAMERFLEQIHKERLEQQLAEGYVTHAALSEQVHKDFAFVDAELD